MAHGLRTAWRSQGGYTVVEMITVFLVISVLTALLVANTRVGDRRQQLRDSTAEFVGLTRDAEARASASSPIAGTSREAYGVCLTSTSSSDAAGAFPKSKCAPPAGAANAYQLYARTKADTDADPSLDQPPDNPDIISSKQLPNGVVFFAANQFYLDYTPPQPVLFVNGNTNNAILYVYGEKEDYYRVIQLRPKSGAIYVQ
ncbi:MAG TPA: hypothetical protein VIF43_03865 [Patescibacteria group bacterium]|jgi:type II secretory pathway pseudopilin PulG